MSENKFDEFFRKKLQWYSSPVPGDMWQRIQEKKEKDRKGFFFKWLLAALPLLFLIAGYFILHTNKNNVPDKAITSATKPPIVVKNNLGEVDKEKVKRESIKPNGDTTGQNNKLPSNNQFNSMVINSKTARHQNKTSVTYQNFSVKNIPGEAYNLKRNEQRARYRERLRSMDNSLNIVAGRAKDSSVNDSQVHKNGISKDPDNVTNITANEIIPLDEDSLSKEKAITGKKPAEEKRLSSLKKQWFLDVYASPDIPINEITAGNVATADFIKKSFKTHLSYTAGLGIGRLINKRFSIKTGFQYSKIIAKMIDSNGVGIASRYMSIDIPFLIGYEIKNIHFKATINAGVVFNLYSWYKGQNPDNYKDNTGISLYAGLSFTKKINDRVELFAAPYFRYRLSYVTKPSAPFNQKIHAAGVSFGIKYNF